MNCIKGEKAMTLKDEYHRFESVQYVTGEEQRTTNNPRKNELAGPKQIQLSVVDVSGDGSKI